MFPFPVHPIEPSPQRSSIHGQDYRFIRPHLRGKLLQDFLSRSVFCPFLFLSFFSFCVFTTQIAPSPLLFFFFKAILLILAEKDRPTTGDFPPGIFRQRQIAQHFQFLSTCLYLLHTKTTHSHAIRVKRFSLLNRPTRAAFELF